MLIPVLKNKKIYLISIQSYGKRKEKKIVELSDNYDVNVDYKYDYMIAFDLESIL